jgi:hypothetical protein
MIIIHLCTSPRLATLRFVTRRPAPQHNATKGAQWAVEARLSSKVEG